MIFGTWLAFLLTGGFRRNQGVVSGTGCLFEGVDALCCRHQWSRFNVFASAAGADGKSNRGDSNIVWHFEKHDGVVVSERKKQVVDFPAERFNRLLESGGSILRILNHGSKGFRGVCSLNQIVGQVILLLNGIRT
jgi:hypothetical protein